ncbi:sensor histidine kinase KdpD [Parasegetibacter sp. NRK P23]|uniref:sensor histidine kinase n=1 Tax=Parasegetibacter sp. NRK P23 TaxID=2942999 RepID=UPI002044C423|nr:HAMP domain-containing sensor histidine kinase [Parasegetibacter sp. NRK P23]MCM5527472.1 HAMP domain-containing histidine kinase [Parasegetibacter sp. NRK P23]
MKKIFPVIIALITLSLIGIIYIQYNWIQNMLIVKEEQFRERVSKVAETVGKDLMEQRGLGLLNRPGKSTHGFNWQSDQLSYDLVRPPSIAQRFTTFEIEEKMQKALVKEGMKDISLEFAIYSPSTTGMVGYFERQSPNFEAMSQDTVRNFTFVYHMIPASGSIAEGLVQDEILVLVVPNVKHILWKSLQWMIAGAILFTLIIISAFYITIATLLRQKKLSEIKSDFINNMTHEFKTPLATISLAIDALRTEKVKQDTSKSDYFSGIIKEENKRMNKHVETILQAALMDRQDVQLNLKPLHVNEMITAALDKFSLQLNEKNGKATVNLQATNDLIEGDEVHFANVISNMIDNAVKYSRDQLQLNISTFNKGKNVVLRFEDNGIGMSKETVKRIFEKFYRAHTGNLHNVKGFGLGLSYVKSIVDAHGGKIKVESIAGKGSAFTIEVPLAK